MFLEDVALLESELRLFKFVVESGPVGLAEDLQIHACHVLEGIINQMKAISYDAEIKQGQNWLRKMRFKKGVVEGRKGGEKGCLCGGYLSCLDIQLIVEEDGE